MSTSFTPPSLAGRNPTDITPADKEAAKSPIEQGMDTSYTVNHTLSCYTVDIASQTLAWWGNKKEQDAKGHDHGKWWQFAVGEVLGDAAAIPFTIATQRFFPGFMHGLEKTLEPIVEPVLKWSTRRSANAWAQEHGMLPDSPEAKEKADTIYRYEIEHLPQAVVWTTYGVPLAVGMHKMVGMEEEVMQLAKHQTISKLISSGGLIGVRSLAPKQMHKWDEWTSKHIYTPMTQIFGGDKGKEAPVAEKMDSPEIPGASHAASL